MSADFGRAMGVALWVPGALAVVLAAYALFWAGMAGDIAGFAHLADGGFWLIVVGALFHAH